MTVSDRARALREAFDRSFAEPLDAGRPPQVDFLAVRCGSDRFALRLSDVSAVAAGRPITRVPSPCPELLGIAGVRSAIVAVYDLALVFGGKPSGAPGCLALIGPAAEVALAFDELEGLLRVAEASLAPVDNVATAREHIREELLTPPYVRPVINVPSLLQSIADRAGPARPRKER